MQLVGIPIVCHDVGKDTYATLLSVIIKDLIYTT